MRNERGKSHQARGGNGGRPVSPGWPVFVFGLARFIDARDERTNNNKWPPLPPLPVLERSSRKSDEQNSTTAEEQTAKPSLA